MARELQIGNIRTEAQSAVQQGGNIRERVRDLTLRALKYRTFEPGQIRQVVRAMTEGIVQGAPRTADLRETLSEAFHGLDHALTKSAEAGSLALHELSSKGTDFARTTVRQGLDDLKRLEDDFLQTVSDTAQVAESNIKTVLNDLVTHARRAGTGTGAKVAETAGAISASMGSLVLDTAKFGAHAASEATGRFAELASGFLAGMADALAGGTAPSVKTKKPAPRKAARRKAAGRSASRKRAKRPAPHQTKRKTVKAAKRK